MFLSKKHKLLIMIRQRFIFLLVLLLPFTSIAQNKEVWMIGPMLHLNIGKEKPTLSYSMEVSYWNYRNVPYSVDFGLEFESNKMRFYSEAQTGIGIAGIALGPVVQYNFNERKLTPGLQTSLWVNFFWGFNFRYRHIEGQSYFCPGTYFKLPTGYGGSSGGGGDSWYSDWDD